MKQALNLRQSQRLTMTPQLQQSIRLLQMSTTDLREELLQAQETNPVLEISDDFAGSDTADNQVSDSPADSTESVQLTSSTHSNSGETAVSGERDAISFDDHYNSEAKNNSAENAAPDQWNTHIRGTNAQPTDGFDRLAEFASPEDSLSLKQLLRNQLVDVFESDHDYIVANHLIDYLNDAGYLEIELSEIVYLVDEECETNIKEVEAVLQKLQTLDPAGIAARNPAECLQLQLCALTGDTEGIHVAKRIVENCLTELARNDHAAMKRRLGLSTEQVRQGVALVKTLNPHPGFVLGRSQTEYVVPDILVKKSGEFWYADLNNSSLPRLLINQDYQALINKNSGNNEYREMKDQLQEARWFISNLDKRYQTILSVAKEIVDRQQGFFHKGPEFLKPMILRDIAEALELHESTISRATAGKYMLTPQGILELKYFFSRQINTSEGEATSSVAVQSIIKDLIEKESSTKPISDNRICKELNDKGFEIARRTVAKYREQMRIPPSSKRKAI